MNFLSLSSGQLATISHYYFGTNQMGDAVRMRCVAWSIDILVDPD